MRKLRKADCGLENAGGAQSSPTMMATSGSSTCRLWGCAMIPLDLRAIARALRGNVWGRNVVAPGPGHSRTDRSLSIKIEPSAADGFLVHSFANDSPIACRDYVRAALGLGPRERRRKQA